MLAKMEPTDREEFESKIAFLERTLDCLNEVVLSQGRSLEALELKVGRLDSRMTAVSDSTEEARDLEAERPPHY